MCEFDTMSELFTIWNMSWNQILKKFDFWQKHNLVYRAGVTFGFIEHKPKPKRESILKFLDKLPRSKKEGS